MTWARFEFVNEGKRTCTLTGIPRVWWVDAAGRAEPYPATRSPAMGSTPAGATRPVTLVPGGHATFELSSSLDAPGGGCPFEHLVGTVQISPPGNRAALELPAPGSPCAITIGPVRR